MRQNFSKPRMRSIGALSQRYHMLWSHATYEVKPTRPIPRTVAKSFDLGVVAGHGVTPRMSRGRVKGA